MGATNCLLIIRYIINSEDFDRYWYLPESKEYTECNQESNCWYAEAEVVNNVDDKVTSSHMLIFLQWHKKQVN